MTKLESNVIENGRDRPVFLFTITSEMRVAGVEAFQELPFGSTAEDVVERVWVAMASEFLGFQE